MPAACAQLRQLRRSVAVGAERSVRIILRRIDRGIGRGVHHQRWRRLRGTRRRCCRGDRSPARDARRDCTVRPWRRHGFGQRDRQLAGAAGNQDRRRPVIAAPATDRHSLRRGRSSGPCRTGSPRRGAIGQGTASAGSFQITPRSASPVPGRGDFVDHLGIRLERAVAVQQSGGDPELLPVLRRQHGAGMLAVRRRAGPRCPPRHPRSRRAPRAPACPARSAPICRCRPRTTPRSADCAWLSCTNGPAMPASAKRAAFQVSEKKPAIVERTAGGVSSSTPGIAVGSTIILLPLGQFHQRPAKLGLAELLRMRA